MRIPSHIGIIPDGNRRWAQANGYSKEKGYAYGLSPGINLLRTAQNYGVKELTYYGFTMDNCKRPAEQLAAFSKACVEAINMITKDKVSLLVIGNTDSKCFPKELKKYTTRTDFNGGGIKVNFLVNYGWEWDLCAGNVRKNEHGSSHRNLKNMLHSKDISRIDLIVRWGGMRRLSGFLPVQSVYSDFYVINEYWPDYSDQQFLDALTWYDKQDVTLGG